jgi:hypothetical protein
MRMLHGDLASTLFVWLVLVCSKRKVLLAGCWWLIYSEIKILLSGG